MAKVTRATRASRTWRLPNVTPHGSARTISASLPPIIKRIADELRPERIILFGSYAYGNPTPHSDIDLLVVMNTDEPRQIKRAVNVLRLIEPREFAVDVIVRTPDEVEYARTHEGFYFLRDVVAKGKVLYASRK